MSIFYEQDEITEPQLQKAAKLLRKGDLSEAKIILATFLKAYPEDRQAWHMLRGALEGQEQQVNEMQKLLQSDPKHPRALSWLARISTPMLEIETDQREFITTEKADRLIFQDETLESIEQPRVSPFEPSDLQDITWLSDLSTPAATPSPRREITQVENVGTSSLLSRIVKRKTILITGNLSSMAGAIAKEFLRERDKVILASDEIEDLDLGLEKAILHSYNPADVVFRDVLSAYRFDVIIYLSTREEQLLDGVNLNTGRTLDGLRNALEMGKNAKRFVYISSTEVYGKEEGELKFAQPHPATINRNTLLAGEQYCNFYRQKYGLNTIIVRVPYIYGPNEKGTLLYRIIDDCLEGRKVELPVGEETLCNFLHAEDVAEFVYRALDESYRSRVPVVDLSSADNLTFRQLIQLLERNFTGIKTGFDESYYVYTRPVEISTARNEFDWVAERRIQTELPRMIASILDVTVPEKSMFQKARDFLGKYQARGILKWVELILGAVLMQVLVEVTSTLLQFKIVDFRLLYVILMGSLHGTTFGLLASLIAGVSGLISWSLLGFDWALLIYNIENWLPFAMYFIAGSVTGYIHDKHDSEIAYKNEETNLLHEKYSFLYGVYAQISQLKDQFREQLVGYRDSFGRIYKVTSELDTFQEDEVFFQALTILEEVMSNESIAIYSLDINSQYGRLEVCSHPLSDKIGKSLKLSDFPKMMDPMARGEIFQNSEMLANYPAYFAPVINDNVPIAAIVIWDASFEQFSLYYANLFRVICGLIQSSLIRASLFLNTNIDRVYIPGTNILESEAFFAILDVKKKMKKSQVSDYQLVKVEPGEKNTLEFATDVSRAIRTTDFLGAHDGEYYVLLSQADKKNADLIIHRLRSYGIMGELVER
ncbi:MAG: NAD-dependent epimerase/dehydratase family protein [Chloroflexi bacterium]|nr:NAD-dependent epimerase/dehydratase family protein [Chloroflexota bacterium]